MPISVQQFIHARAIGILTRRKERQLFHGAGECTGQIFKCGVEIVDRRTWKSATGPHPNQDGAMMNPSASAPDISRLTHLPVDELYAEFGTRPEGLSTAEADARLEQYGLNILPEAEKLPLSHKALAQFRNLFNILLVLAAILSFITGVTSDDMSSINMGFAILIVVIASVLFSIFQEFRAERAVDALRQLVPKNIKVMRDGKMTQLATSEIVPGDVIALEDGDRIPADARLTKAFELSVDNSVLTGESEPQQRFDTCDNPEDCAVEDITNLVFAGTTVTSGSATAVVLATGINSKFGQVVGITHAIEEPLSPLQREINYTAKLNFIVAIAIGFLFLVIALEFLHAALPDSLLFMIGVMVALVPEGLQVTLTLSLAISSLTMAKRNVVVKRLSSVETLGSTTVICTDKTGTITEGQMTVRKIWMGGQVFDVSGEGYEPEGRVSLGEKHLRVADRSDLRTLCEVAALDNKATLVPPIDRKRFRWTAIGDSTDAALLVMAAKAGLDQKKVTDERPRIGMIPFDSNRKMMTSVHRAPGGVVSAYVKGAAGAILSRCTRAQWDDDVVPLDADILARIRTQVDTFARETYRVIALAVRTFPGEPGRYESESVETDLTFLGLVAIFDPPRRDVELAVRRARSAGIKVMMLTGDHELTAEAIARKVGIITGPDRLVMSCERLPEKSDEELSQMLDAEELVFARVTPEQKLRIVRLLREKGETVAVTGDGVNDAPALLEADIGIAMGITGTDVARESADMVLLNDNFASIVGGIEIGRSVFDNLKKFIVYVFGHNWAELLAFIVFVLLQTPLPLTVVGVLAIDLVLELPPSLALTMEPPEPGIMDRPPRSRDSRLFDARTLARSCYIGTLTGLVAIFWCFQLWSDGGWSLGQSSISNGAVYARGVTVVIVGIMAGQLGNLFATRTNVKSSFSLSPTRNRWLLPSIVAELAILVAIVYVPFIQPIIGTSSLRPFRWALLFAIAPVILMLEEARKYVLRTTLPPAPVPVPSPVSLAQAGATTVTYMETATGVPFTAVGGPVVILSFSPADTRNAIPVASSLAEQSGSKILVASDRGLLKAQADVVAAGCGVPCELTGLDLPAGSKGRKAAARAIEKYAEKNGAELTILPVERGMFAKRGDRKTVEWIEEFKGKRVVLVSGQTRRLGDTGHPLRLLIPVLDEFHPEVFALAGALTSSMRIPDVDVVAARVIKMPPTVPLYSTYRPESLVDAEKELSFLRTLSGLPLLRHLSSRVLLVRDISRDLVDFVQERRIDLILLQGDWAQSRHGFLGERERSIASKAQCGVAVLLPSVPGARNGNG